MVGEWLTPCRCGSRAQAAAQVCVNVLGGVASYPAMIAKAQKALRGEQKRGSGAKTA